MKGRAPAAFLLFALLLTPTLVRGECDEQCVRNYTQYLINERIKLELKYHELEVNHARLKAELDKATKKPEPTMKEQPK